MQQAALRLALAPLVAPVDPAPFELETGVATVEDARERARLEQVGRNGCGFAICRMQRSTISPEPP